MAVIRCPNCGKPNPDIVEVCQYCDTPLQAAPVAPPPAAAPSGGPKVIRCPNCGKPNPAFLEVCQYCDTPLPPATEQPQPGAPQPAEAPAAQLDAATPTPPEAEPMDWLQQLRTSQEMAAEEAPAPTPAPEPDWMWTGAAAEQTETPAAGDETPDWLRATGALPEREATQPEPTEAAPPAPAEGLPDWLRTMRDTLDATPEAVQPPAEDTLPDWLQSMRPAQSEAAGPLVPEPPDWLREGAPAADEEPAEAPAAPGQEALPEWLRPSTITPPTAAPAEPAQPEAPAGPTPEADLPDWLQAMRTASSGPAQPAATTAAEEELPEWLRAMRAAAPEAPVEPATAPSTPPATGALTAPLSPPEVERPGEADEPPDWLQALRTSEATQEGTPAPVAPKEPLGWLSGIAGSQSAPKAPETPAGAEEELPEWLRAIRPAPADVAGPAVVPPEAAPDTTARQPEPGQEGYDWLSALSATAQTEAEAFAREEEGRPAPGEPSAAPAEEMPEWLRSLRGQPEEKPVAPEAMPEWLRSLRGLPTEPAPPASTAAAPEPPEAPPSEQRDQTALPGRVAAMRPVDVERPGEAEADVYEERVGVLAGMRGVLRAEPAVAVPHKAATRVQQLQVSQSQAAQAAMLAELLQQEAQPRPAFRRRVRVGGLLERWLVFLGLALFVLVPQFVVPGLFAAPQTIGQETLAAFEQIERAPTDRPALVAFDYEPGQQGELNPAASAMVTHLLRRGAPVVAVSTRLAGAGVGQAVLSEAVEQISAQTGVTPTYATAYLNLGFIPGGPVGLVQFVNQPRSVFRTDFTRQYTQTASVWDAPVISRVQGLRDFGLIVLVTGTPEAARAWIEQSRLQADAPIVAAVTAGAEPMVRPYLEADPPQLAGLVAGIVGAAQYERQAGLSAGGTAPAGGSAAGRWEAVGGGLLAAVLLIAGGNLVYGATTLLRRRKA